MSRLLGRALWDTVAHVQGKCRAFKGAQMHSGPAAVCSVLWQAGKRTRAHAREFIRHLPQALQGICLRCSIVRLPAEHLVTSAVSGTLSRTMQRTVSPMRNKLINWLRPQRHDANHRVLGYWGSAHPATTPYALPAPPRTPAEAAARRRR